MSDQKIKIRLPNARQKLQPLFPQDSRGDIKIIFANKSFKLQKAFLRLESGFFKKKFAISNDILQIKEQFNEKYFTNVLKCFYGYSIEIIRNQILDYYPIIKFLEVESLLKLLRQDMVNKAESYDIFILLQLAHKYDEQEVFQICLSQFEKQGYEQLRYAKLQLFKCPMELFKMIIKTHNRMKSQKGKGIQYMQVDQLIRDFSQQKRLNESQYQELKFQLIDKKSLTSQEYKEIFLDDVKRKKTGNQYKSVMKVSSSAQTGLFNSHFGGGSNILAASKLTQSVIEPLKQMNDGLTLEMENTFQKKKNEQLQAENILLLSSLKSLQEGAVQNKKKFQQLKETVASLLKKIEQQEKVIKEHTLSIKKLNNSHTEMKNQIIQKSNLIKKLQDRVVKIQKQPAGKSGNPKYLLDEDQENSKSISSQISQIIPGHLLKQMVKAPQNNLIPSSGFKKSKPVPPQPAPVVVAQEKEQQQLDEDEIQQLYLSRLQFNQQPKGCPKKFLPKLANFLTTDGFQKKKLDLIFRRTANNENWGQSEDLRNKNSLLVLINTKLGQVIGGFTSITIYKNSSDFLSDQNAYIFSLTKNQKFKIKKSHINQAIYVSSDYYLLGFSNDITIPLDCIKTQSECQWPASYENNGQKRSSRWLTGEETSFSIRTIEIYEVKEQEMVMDLL